jgi:plasmid stability protein
MTLARFGLLGVALGFALVGGCRCKEETLAPVVFDQAGDQDVVDPNKVLAPPWQPPLVTQLSNGALLHWLREDDNPAFHVRVLLPTAIDADKLSAAATASALEAIELRLGPRLRRLPDARLELRSRPGRVEIAVHGRDADAEALLDALADTFADAGNPKLLAVAQGKVLARHREVGPSALATAALVSTLLEHPLANEYASKQDLVELSKNRLEKGWSLLTDPRDAVVLVHARRDPEDELMRDALERLGTRWKGHLAFGSGKGKTTVTARLRAALPEQVRDTFLLTAQAGASLQIHTGKPERGNRAVVMIGRLIPTATIEERTLARMSQRLLQEELDVRLLVAGPVSILAIKVRVSPSDPIGSLKNIVERMRAFVAVTQPRDRVEQAANLWLGARMVEASLTGEDWTSLWSESIDLAGEDREIYVALARDAKAMLELQPEQIQAYMAKWFDPQAGEPGWVWVAAGVDDNFRTKLDAGLELEELVD